MSASDLRPEQMPHAEHPMAPTTTTQEDLTTAGQRQINLIWERTQSGIALTVVLAGMGSGLLSMFNDKPVPTIISIAFGTIVGFYFSRTNHAAIGGVGRQPVQPKYEGR